MARAVKWIANDDTNAARRLDAAFQQGAVLIGSRPDIGRMRRDLVGGRYRIWSRTSFPYLIIYDPERGPPRIVSVTDTSRNLPAALADLRD